MEKFYTPAEVAEMLGIKRATLWKWLREGYIQATTVGHSYIIPESELPKILEKAPKHPGKPQKPGTRRTFFIRVNGKPVRVTGETIPDDPVEREIMWRTFFLEHPEYIKKKPGENEPPKLVVTGLPGGLRESFERMAEEARKYEDGTK